VQWHFGDHSISIAQCNTSICILHVASAAAVHFGNFASGVVDAKSCAALEVLKGKCKPAILCQLYFAPAKSHLKESFQTYMSAGTSLPVSCSVLCKLLAY